MWNVDQAIAANAGTAVTPPVPVAAGTRPVPRSLRPPPAGFPPPPAWAPRPTARESSPRSVQGILLALGGLLLTVAVVVFTVVAWGRFGLAGRAAILMTLTAVTLGLPAWLVRHRLTATAETIALLGLVLMCTDAYAAYRAGALGLDRADGWGYAAAATAVIAAVAVAYPALVPVRLTRVAGLSVAQLPVPLAVGALPRVTPTGTALAATIAIGLNVAVLAATRGRVGLRPERVIAWIFGGVAAAYAIPVAAIFTFADAPARPAATLALAGLLIVGAAVLAGTGLGRALLAGLGILPVAAAGVGLALPSLHGAGAVAPAGAALLLALAALAMSRNWRRGSAGAAWVLFGAAGLAILTPVTVALAGPFLWLRRPWAGAPVSARVAVGPHVAWSYSPSVLATALLLAAAATGLASLVAGRRAVLACSYAGLLLAAVLAPLALGSTRVAALATQGAVAAVCCLFAALLRRGLGSLAAGAAGLALLSITLAGSLAERPGTVIVLAATAVLLAGCAVVAGRATVGAVAAGLLGPALAAEAAAVVLVSGGTATGAAWAMLGVAAAAAAAAHVAERRLPLHARALVIGVLGTLAAGALPMIGALATVGRPLVQAYAAPYAWFATGWGAAPGTVRALAPGVHWSGGALVPAVLAVIGIGVAAALAATLGRPGGLVAPAAAGATAAVLAATALAWSLATAPATVVALSVLAAATLVAAVHGRTTAVVRVATVVAGSAAVLDGVAATMAAGQPAYVGAFGALAVAAGLALAAAVGRRTRPWEAVAGEWVAAAGGLVGVALTVTHPLALSVALCVAGTAVGATALRPDRRWASLVGTVLLIAASWVRLADIGVT
ncbi:MAG: hypothetical protein DLM59_10625, partial [Pseudonocardiales bacterium]